MNLPFRFVASFVALILVLSCGCLDLDLDFATFTNPTVEPDKAKVQPDLFGSYFMQDPSARKKVSPETTIVHVGKAGDGFPVGFLRTAIVEFGADGKMDVNDPAEVFFATKIDDFYVLNMPTPKEAEHEIDLDLDLAEAPPARVVQWKPEHYEGFTLLILKPTQAGFALYSFDNERLKAEIKAGRLAGEYMTKKEKEEYNKKKKLAQKEGKATKDSWRPLTVKASPQELRVFIERHSNDVIDRPFMLLNRVR